MIKEILRKILPIWLIQSFKKARLYLYRIRNGLKLINSNYKIIQIGDKRTNTYFGYYDITPFNSKNELVYLEVPKGESYANIVLNDLSGNNKKVLTTTRAFNTQQGARLRWLPNSDDIIIFNDHIDGRYVSRKFNIHTSEEIIIPYPLYDISPNGRLGLTLNFERLGVLRPGYGYTNKPYNPEADLSSECISIIDMQTFQCTPIITYKEIADVMGEDNSDFSFNYINHLSFSPNSDKFLFFWLNNNKNCSKANLLLYDLGKRKTTVLENELRVSHYTWVNNDKILCTAISGSTLKDMECRYYEYQVGMTRKIVCQNILKNDGHPSFYRPNIIITDTYPNVYSYQSLFFCNLENGISSEIVYSYSVPVKNVEFRTDMHPRFNMDKTIICYDANVKGERRLFLIKDWSNAIN